MLYRINAKIFKGSIPRNFVTSLICLTIQCLKLFGILGVTTLIMVITKHQITEIITQQLFQSLSDHLREEDKTKRINENASFILYCPD